MGVSALAAAHEDGVRMALTSAVEFAVVSLATGVLLPYFIQGPIASAAELARVPRHSERAWLGRLRGLPLPNLWVFSHLLFAAAMLFTFFIQSESGAMRLIAILGVPWALSSWIPHTILGREIAKRQLGSTGALVGLHNTFIAAPQIVSVVACTVVFKAAELVGSYKGIVIMFRLGALLALQALYFTFKLR